MQNTKLARCEGRPADAANRLPSEQACYELLDKLGISYERVDHEPAFSIEMCADIEEVIDCEIAKNLLLCNRQKTEFWLLVMPGRKPFRTKDFSKIVESSRLSFADADDMFRLLGLSPGSVSILGLMNDKNKTVRLAFDRETAQSEYFGCHPCINTSSLRLRTCEVFDKLLPALGYRARIVELPLPCEGSSAE